MKINIITMPHSPSIFESDGEITSFEVNGEQAKITWYRQIKDDGSVVEVNGSFVERIDYKNNK